MNDREEAAKLLAKRHYLFEPAITEIRTINSRAISEPNEPIRLLEVNANTVASGIMPLRFDAVPASGIPYTSVIVEVTPEEYERIKQNQLKLPDGWVLGPVLPKPDGAPETAFPSDGLRKALQGPLMQAARCGSIRLPSKSRLHR
jgi:hypothetical protein